MKHILTLPILLLLVSNLFSQHSLVVKTFVAQVSWSCIETADGGCVIYGYCKLEFEKDSVSISEMSRSYCTPKDNRSNLPIRFKKIGKYNWNVKNDSVHIIDFNKYGIFKIKQNILTSKDDLKWYDTTQELLEINYGNISIEKKEYGFSKTILKKDKITHFSKSKDSIYFPPKITETILKKDQWNSIKKTINLTDFYSLPDLTGCSDCFDMNTTWIKIKTKSGFYKISYNSSKPIELMNFFNEFNSLTN